MNILTFLLELEEGNNKEYKVEVICYSKVYAKKSDSNYLLSLYYCVSKKNYLEEVNTWKSVLAIQYLERLITTFHKEYLEKPTTISSPIDFILLIVRTVVK